MLSLFCPLFWILKPLKTRERRNLVILRSRMAGTRPLPPITLPRPPPLLSVVPDMLLLRKIDMGLDWWRSRLFEI